MKVTTIKQYENTYYFTFGYNGKQFGESDKVIDERTETSRYSEAHERFVKDMNRYSSVPTPEYEDCTIFTVRKYFTEESGGYRVYTVTIRVIWQYTK